MTLPDSDLLLIVLRRIDCQIVEFTRRGTFPADDWEDGAVAYRAFFMHRWLTVYGHALLKHGSHDHAIYLAAHRGVINEISHEALGMTRSMLWRRRRQSR